MAISNSLLMWLRSFLTIMCLLILICTPVKAKICGEIDARNDPTSLEQLRGCNLVVGSVSIVLMERANASYDINNASFPELREITGYLLFFRVFKLKSIRKLFPNLTVVRGDRLIRHYALILHDMPDLREIGLISLIKIIRGLVMIRYCPVLCYVNTINWDIITDPHMFNDIGNYLGYDSSDACPTTKSCSAMCPHGYCWNNQHCQLFDENEFQINDRSKITCHDECIGGCVDTTPNTCNVCRNFRILENGTCVNKCPPDLFVYYSLCVNAKFCKKRRQIPMLGECRPYCDSIAGAEITDPSQCVRSCGGIEVESLASSDLVRGCHIIYGDLIIRLVSGVVNTMQILEQNLGDIEEVHGILHVHRSPVITSLSFLRNLRIVHGDKTEHGQPVKYSFIITLNDNLEELWDFNEKKTLELTKGFLLIQFNRKLCLSHIRELQKTLKGDRSKDFVSSGTNGYEQTCITKTMATWHKVLDHTSVEINWNRIKITDAERIMGYLIYYVAAPQRNITHRGIDTCVQYGWKTHFIQNITDITEPYHTTIITNLTQNTQYAYYVKTQVVPKINESVLEFTGQGQSNIEYFVTDADVPNSPQVQTISKSYNSLTLGWHPLLDNELIDFYRVDYFIQPDEHDFLDSRDYCVQPRIEINLGIEMSDGPSSPKQQNCKDAYENWRIRNPDVEDPDYAWRMYRKAQCAAHPPNKRSVDDNVTSQVNKYINNHQIHKIDYDHVRFSRQIHEFVLATDNVKSTEPDFGPNYIGRKEFPNGIQQHTFNNLLPYTIYVFQFFACFRPNNCSAYFLHFDRTDMQASADNMIFNIVSDPYDYSRVHLDFDEPKHPNGLTVAFQIEKHYLEHFKIKTICLTRKQHYENGKRYTFDHLDNGRYVFRVRSVSLAQAGAFSQGQFIIVSTPNWSVILRKYGSIFLFVLVASVFLAVIYFLQPRLRPRRFRLRRRNASNQDILPMVDIESSSGTQQERSSEMPDGS